MQALSKRTCSLLKPDATDEEILDALHKASCDYLITRSPKGINTIWGEGGMKLSGGEKQRLSIARALLRHPRLLIFDEATSALDSLTEEDITNTIRSISASREQITILIAHRLSTIMHADVIYVLEKRKNHRKPVRTIRSCCRKDCTMPCGASRWEKEGNPSSNTMPRS